MCDTACPPARLNRFSRAIVFPPATLSRALRFAPTLDRGPACGKMLREEKRFSYNLFSLAQLVACVCCAHMLTSSAMLLLRLRLTDAVRLFVPSGKIIHEATIFSRV
jgi:hypothetical protein